MVRLFRWIKSLFVKPEPVVKPPTKTPIDEKPVVKPPVSDRVKKFAKTNMAGIILITRFEGFYPEPYLCPANVATIGYGTIVYPSGKKVKLTDPPCTEDQAKEWLAHELKDKEDRLNSWLIANNITVTENEFSALMSFGYNVGLGRVIKGSVADALKAGDMSRVAERMALYNKARNRWGVLRELRGLTRRRQAEIALLKTP